MSKLTVNSQTGKKHTATPIMWIGTIGGVGCLIAQPLLFGIWGIEVNLNEVGWTLLLMGGASVASMVAKS